MKTITHTTKGLFIFGLNFDQQATREFAINLFDWSGKNHGVPMRININSLGGNPLDALFLFEIFGQLRKLGHHLTIAVNGRCASCACWLIQAADKRVIGANSWLMFHQISSAANGNMNAMKRELARDEQLNEQTIKLFCSRSKFTPAHVHAEIDDGKDWWISAEEALHYRLVDAVEYAPAFA
jgi:ATP-dependent protease ClpP protease subunit